MDATIANRRHLIAVALAAFISGGTLGCGGTEPVDEPDVTAIVDGVRFESQLSDVVNENGRLKIVAENNVGTTLSFDLHGDTAGSYDLGNQLNHAVYADLGNEWVAFGVRAGELIVSELNESRVAGVFGFRGKDTAGINPSRQISAGSFNIEFN